jgi:hypothetical protein
MIVNKKMRIIKNSKIQGFPFNELVATKRIWKLIIRSMFHLFVYLSGKPMMPHLFCNQGFAVGDYDFTLDAADMGHPRLSFI